MFAGEHGAGLLQELPRHLRALLRRDVGNDCSRRCTSVPRTSALTRAVAFPLRRWRPADAFDGVSGRAAVVAAGTASQSQAGVQANVICSGAASTGAIGSAASVRKRQHGAVAVIRRLLHQRCTRFEPLLNELVPAAGRHGLLAHRPAHDQPIGRAGHADIKKPPVFVLRAADHIRARLRDRCDLIVAIGHPDEAIGSPRHGARRSQREQLG